MKKEELTRELIMIFLLSVFVVIILMVLSGLQDAQKTLDNCKSKGWDGVSFVSKYSSELECSNFTQAEKDARIGEIE